MDGAGRVLVSPELRAAGRLEKEVMLLGMGSHFELWDAQTYAAKEQAGDGRGHARRVKRFHVLIAGYIYGTCDGKRIAASHGAAG